MQPVPGRNGPRNDVLSGIGLADVEAGQIQDEQVVHSGFDEGASIVFLAGTQAVRGHEADLEFVRQVDVFLDGEGVTAPADVLVKVSSISTQFCPPSSLTWTCHQSAPGLAPDAGALTYQRQ